MHLVRHAARALAAAALLQAGCGGEATGPLDWKDDPIIQIADGLPQDRIVAGTVRNVSVKDDLELDATGLKVRDADGREVRAFAIFSSAYAHGLYGAYQRPDPFPADERRRLGYVVSLEPGADAPLVVAYRLRKGLRMPLRLDYGHGSLELPR